MARQWTVMAALVALCALPATSGWLLEGLVASWVVPDVQAGDRNRVQPKRTQPLQLPEEKEQEPMEFVPPRPHPATEPPERKPHRTPPGADDKATPTVRDIEATAQLYRLLKDRRRSDRRSMASASSWRQSKPACMQRFICEVHMQEDHELAKAGDVEKNVANTLRRFTLELPDSAAYQYTYAAHMGRLMRDSPSSSCHEMFSSCPFSREDMLLLMQSLTVSKPSLA